jgi:hypothetical protein
MGNARTMLACPNARWENAQDLRRCMQKDPAMSLRSILPEAGSLRQLQCVKMGDAMRMGLRP